MEQFSNLKKQILREYGIVVHNISEDNNYSPSYIGPKSYVIHYEDPQNDGKDHVKLLPSHIGDDLASDTISWDTVSAIVNFMLPLAAPKKETESVDYRRTSCKRRTRKELNKIKVRGYYENM